MEAFSRETMTTKDAKTHLANLVVQALKENDCLPEASPEINDASRAVIEAMREEFGSAWLGNVNLYTPEDHKRVVWKHDGGLVHNFEAAFVMPTYDPETERLIRERAAAPYTGTAEDAPRIEAIHQRILLLGGVILYWT